MNWLRRGWAAHVEHVKLRRWESVSYESDNEGLELPTDDNELAAPVSSGPSGLDGSAAGWAEAEAASRGAFGATTPRPNSGPE
jgi:hypothetical protein